MSIEKYPFPEGKKTAKDYWAILIVDVAARGNVKDSHLQQLKVLCELYARHDKLCEWMEENGYTYEVEARNGNQIKEHIEVGVWKKTLNEIRAYSRILGLQLVKDAATNKDPEEGQEWK